MARKAPPTFDSRAFLARVGNGRSIGNYAAGHIVFSQGEPADAVFYIQKGKVKITVVSEEGKEAVVALLGPKEFFGEGGLAGQSKRISTAMAMLDSVISRIEKSTILRLIHEEPAFSEVFIAHLLGRAVRVTGIVAAKEVNWLATLPDGGP